MSRFGHVAMIESVNLEKYHILMAVETKHTHKIGILFISSEKLDLTVTGNHEHRSGISTYMEERSELVDCRCEVRDTLLLPLREVCDNLTAVWHKSLDLLVRIDIVFCKVRLVQTEHADDISTCRMTCEIHLRKVTSIPCYIIQHPINRCRSIIQSLCKRNLCHKTVAHSYYDCAIAKKSLRNMSPSACKSASVEPDYDRAAFRSFFVSHIKTTHLFCV